MNNNGKVFLAGLTGAVVGAGVAILLAPASGKETRKKMADKMKETKDSIKSKIKKKGEEFLDKVDA